jgi:hypothetical protein
MPGNIKDIRELPVFVAVAPIWIKLTKLRFMLYGGKGNKLKRGWMDVCLTSNTGW